MNRFGEMERIEHAIHELTNEPSDDILRYQEPDIQYLRAVSTSGNQAITEQILKLVNLQISTLLDEHGFHPFPNINRLSLLIGGDPFESRQQQQSEARL